MGQKKFEKRLQKKQFYKKMIRMSETNSLLQSRKEADQIRSEMSKSKNNINDLYEKYTEITDKLASLPSTDPEVLHLSNYIEIFITPKINSYNSSTNKVTKKDYFDHLIDFRNLNNEIKRIEEKFSS